MRLKKKEKPLPCFGAGFNNIYPEENIELFHKIIENDGLLITEHPPETEVKLSRYPFRNRIISGLSKGTLVVEARHRSGSTVTARYAKEQGRKVFSIPSNIGIKTGVGTNRLIQEGAKLVICPQDILEEFNIFEEQNEYAEIEIKIEEQFQEIYNVLTYMPTNINVIAKKCKLNISEVMQKLLLMEVKGYIKALPGNEYVRL